MFWSLLQFFYWVTTCKHFVESVADHPICDLMARKKTTKVVYIGCASHEQCTLHDSVTDDVAEKLEEAEVSIYSKCF
jgi:hypothetical protein